MATLGSEALPSALTRLADDERQTTGLWLSPLPDAMHYRKVSPGETWTKSDVVAGNRLGPVAKDPSRLLVTVLKNPADRKRLVPLTRRDWAPEALSLGVRVAYLWCPEGMIASPLADAVFRLLGDAWTTRNWATLTKLHGLAAVPDR